MHNRLLENLTIIHNHDPEPIKPTDVQNLREYFDGRLLSTVADMREFLFGINRPAELIYTFLSTHLLYAFLSEESVVNDASIITRGLLLN